MADRELEHLPAGHEHKDVNPIAVTRFGIGLAITLIVTVFAIWGLFNYFVGSKERLYGGGAPLSAAEQNAMKAPPQPRLQSSPPIDLRDMRAAEDQLLHAYSWVDRDKGVVRMPIDRAMDILAQRGLAARPAADQPQGTTK